MPKQLLKGLKLDEVSHCAQGVNPHAKVVLFKSQDVNKREFSAEEREKLAEEGKALSDGSFPIVNTTDLSNAVQAFGRADNKQQVARHIKKRAKALDAMDQLPEEGDLAEMMRKAHPLAEALTERALSKAHGQDGTVPDFDDIVRDHMAEREARVAMEELAPLLDGFRSSVEAAINLAENQEDRRSMIRSNAEQFAERVDQVLNKSVSKPQHGLVKSVFERIAKSIAGDKSQPQEEHMPKISKEQLDELPQELRKHVEELPAEAQEGAYALAKAAADAQAQAKEAQDQLAKAKQAEPAEDETPEIAKAREAGAPQAVIDLMKAQQKSIDQANEALAKQAAEREQNAQIEKAKGYTGHLSADASEVGAALYRLRKGQGTDEDVASIEKALKGANEAARQADIFKSYGSATQPDTGSAEQQVIGKAQELRKTDPNLTEEQAYAKALRENPDLQQALYEEQRRH